MKRLFTFFAAAAVAVSVMAEGHMKFKGVEINGSKAQFVSQLERRGCMSGKNGFAVEVIEADFAGVAMYVLPLTTSQTKTIYAVVASTTRIEDKAAVKAQYNSLKKLMDDKYGNGQEVALEDGYYVNLIGDFERGNANEAIKYTAAEGSIVLYTHEATLGYNVVVEYHDKANNALRQKEANEDI